MAALEPIIIVKENGLEITIQFTGGDPGDVSVNYSDAAHVVLTWENADYRDDTRNYVTFEHNDSQNFHRVARVPEGALEALQSAE